MDKYLNNIHVFFDAAVLIGVLGFVMAFYLISKRIDMVKELIISYIREMEYRAYCNAKLFIQEHEKLPGLSEFQQAQMDGAKKHIARYESNLKANDKN